MGIRAVAHQAPEPGPEPKALCAACGRPMAVLKATTCVYCGAANPEGLPEAAAGSIARAMPPEMLLMTSAPREQGLSRRRLWTRRILALGTTILLMVAFVGSCMRT